MKTYEALLDEVTAFSGKTRTIFDPATGEIVGEAPVHDLEYLERAVAGAQAAQPAWAAVGHDARSAALLKAADAVERSAEELARLLSREQGKPLNGPNARFEVGACAAWLRAAATIRLEPEMIVDDGETRAELHYKPIGVVGAIGPWNWPMMITIWQIAPALRMGNAVVVKPSGNTPLSVLALVKVLNEELPEGILSVVSCGREVGARLTDHPAIGKIMFTGSTAAGRAIIKSSADTVKRLTLELGGNDAGIVLPTPTPRPLPKTCSGAPSSTPARPAPPSSASTSTRTSTTPSAKNSPRSPRRCRWATAWTRTTSWARCRTRHSTTSWPTSCRQRRTPAPASCWAETRTPASPATSTPPPWWRTSTTTTRLWPRNSSAPPCPSSATAPSTKQWKRPTGSTSASAPPFGPPTSPPPGKSRARIQAGTVWINKHGAVDPRIPFGGAKQSGYGLEFGVEGLKALGVPQVING